MTTRVTKKENPLSVLINNVNENSNSQLKALFKTRDMLDKSKETEANSEIKGEMITVDINLIDPNPYQPRKRFNESSLKEFAESIKAVGQISPVVVRRAAQGRYELIAGERRWRAISIIGWKEINIIIRDADDSQMALVGLAENLDREDLSDYETGIALGNMLDIFKNKTEVSEYFKRTKKDVHRLLAFNSFPVWIKDRLDENPNLISKTISQSLKAVFEGGNYKEENHRSFIDNALNQMERGDLTQSLFVANIKRFVDKQDNTKSTTKTIISKSYKHAGNEIGKFVYDNKRLSIKLNSSIIDKELAEEIFQLIDQKIKDRQ